MYKLSKILKKRITIEEYQGDRWNSVKKVSAYINALSENKFMGLEIFQSMQLINYNPYMFIIRYYFGLKLCMRINYDDRIFSIKRIIKPKESNIILKIIAEEELT